MALSSESGINFEVVNNRKVYKCGISINNNMRAYKKAIASGLVLGALALPGCAYNPNTKNNLKNKPSGLEETVKGVPISVKVAAGMDNSGGLSAVIKTSNGKYLLCSATSHYPSSDLIDAAALIEAKMKEGKQIEIERYGKYNCIMKSVSAYGHTIDVGY